jgi:CubicO group peptidase (beta-lactamase class C family)
MDFKTFSPEHAYYELVAGTQNRPDFHLFTTKSAFRAINPVGEHPMLSKRVLTILVNLILVFAVVSTPLSAMAQVAATPAKSQATDLSAKLAKIETTLDARRQQYGVPGASLVIVKDDQIIYMKGLGYKDLEKKVAVTPDTLFAIGSSTKAFTALTVLLSADEGKLSLDDSPKKYLPYFKMYDPETDAKITIRDLLSHSSGLNRTDLAFAVGTLNREEVIRVAGLAKPTAKLREKFQYQNAMFTAAGEVAAHAQGKSWESLVQDRIFKPLGMKTSDLSVETMQKSSDFSYGYTYNTDTKLNRRVPMRDIPSAAPAGAINSSAREMAQWVRFMLAGGVYDGKRLVSEKSFTEFTSPQMKMGGKASYGLGWFLRDWRGHKVIEHGGNIDGFNAQVALMPDQKLGFVLLTNLTASPLGQDAMLTIWDNLVETPGATTPATTDTGAVIDPKLTVGTYKFAEASMNVEIAMVDGKPALTVPGQPQYVLANVSGNRYQLINAGTPLEGFFVTFRPPKDKPTEYEIFLEQPNGTFVLSKLKAEDQAKDAAVAANYDGPLKELIGSYRVEGGGGLVEVAVREGKVSLVVPGQQPYELVPKEKDVFELAPLPTDSYKMNVRRDPAGKVAAIAVTQPEGVFTFAREATVAITMPVDELMAKMIAASGGEAAWRKHKSMVTQFQINFVHQGITAEGTTSAKAPNLMASQTNLIALGKKIGTIFEYFDGTTGGQETSFSPSDTYTGKQLANAKVASDFYGLLNWKTLFKSVEIKRMDKVGGEDVYVVVMTTEGGTPTTLFVSTKTFLPLKKETIYSPSDSSGIEIPITETYSDYRAVDEMMFPHKTVTNNIAQGDIIVEIKDVKFDVDIPDSMFKPGKK